MFKNLKAGAAGLALVLAICSAFTNARNVQRAETRYGVTQQDATTFTVEDITGQEKGEDFRCEKNESQACVVTADSTDVVDGVVQRTDASIKDTGEFTPLP